VSKSFQLPRVEWATVGTVGPPGQRTFYLQARQEDQLVTVKLEKQQVALIAQFVGEILSDLPVPEALPDDDALDLAEPVAPDWAVGGLQLGYDGDADRLVLLAEELVEDNEEEDVATELGAEQLRLESGPASSTEAPGRGVGRLGLTRTQAASIVRRAWDLVNAGRPTCALCGDPIDPDGHSCPRTNGHRPQRP
jgi:uncharacterized repeat protein (TIGR03847 family)